MLVTLRALAILSALLAVGMLISAIMALGSADSVSASLFAGQAAVLLFLAFAVRIGFAGRREALGRQIGFRVLVVLWLAGVLLAAPPFWLLTDLPWHLALFEAASAFTTTGATVYGNLETVPTAIIAWRATLQWLGGLFTLASIIVVLAPSGAGGTPLLRVGGDMEQILRHRLRGVIGVYLAVTLACFALLLPSQIGAFDAFALTLSTVSTGGMMPRPGSLSDYGAPLAEWVIGLFMLIGATSLMWYRLVATGRLGRSITVLESGALIGIAVVLGAVYAIAFSLAAGSETVLGPLDAVREGFVTAASLVSTTGFEARNAGATALPLALVLCVVLIGGGMFSTAGGVKLYRVALMGQHASKELEHIIYPHAVHIDHLGRFAYDTDGMRAIWTALVLFLGVWALCTFVVAGQGVPADAAVVASLASLANAGPVYAFGWADPGAWPAFADMSAPATTALSLTMVAGRLEVIGLIAGFSAQFFQR
ncbi:MAG: TrkH family potassium uptake protein [Devosiaceae bacterium]|nr:TrkH family potassium uptake protein [Devosiaceae bacterium MH13]